MMTIDILPQDIFQHIQTFLTNGDYHYFLNSSKKFCEDLKRKTFFFKLTKEKSVEYVMNKEFQDLLLSKVENGWNQIGIICSHLFISNIPIDLPICKISVSNDQLPFHLWNNYKSIDCRFYGGAKGIPLFPTVKDLFLRVMLADIKETPMIDLRLFSHLSSFRVNDLKVKDVTALKDIPHLYLSSCTELTDFTVLSNQRELTLHQCRGLTDVTSFRSIRKLSISYCENVSDVSPLKGIYDLTLQGCSNIKDISCLGNHHRLSVSTISSGFDVLLHIPHVTLMSCDIDDLDVLRFAKSVSLGQCQKIKSVSPLKTVKKVMILNSGESGFTELGEVPDLSLSLRSGYKLNDESIACFKSKRLILTNSTSINTLEVFSSSIQHLHIGESEDFAKLINDGQGVLLQHLLSLTLDKLSVVRLEGLGLIPTVRLVRCNALQTMKGLGSNRCVVVDVCSALKDLSSLASVPIVTIKYCARLTITDYECLKNVPRLKILVD